MLATVTIERRRFLSRETDLNPHFPYRHEEWAVNPAALTRDHLTMAALLKAIVCLPSSGLDCQKPAEVHLWLVRP